MKRNKFSKALKHLKSTELDERIHCLDETISNKIGGVYALNQPGFRLGEKDPARVFYPDVDGNWPAGIPGTPGERTYTRPPGYWDSGPGSVPAVDWDQTINVDLSHSGTSTDGFIDASTGTVLVALPPGGSSFILGPLVDGYVYNHGYDDYTNIGYIQKDTRQFVLLGRVQGYWKSGISGLAIANTNRQWDGTSGQFTAINPSFTLEMAQWFRDEYNSNRFVKNVSYYYSGGYPQSGNPDPDAPSGSRGGSVPGVGNGGDVGSSGSIPHGRGNGSNVNIGTPQDPPNHGGPEDASLYGYMYVKNEKTGEWEKRYYYDDGSSKSERSNDMQPGDPNYDAYKAGGGDAKAEQGYTRDEVISIGMQNFYSDPAFSDGGGVAKMQQGYTYNQVLEIGRQNQQTIIDLQNRINQQSSTSQTSQNRIPILTDADFVNAEDAIAFKAGGGNAALQQGKLLSDIINQGKINKNNEVRIGSVNLSDPKTQENINTALNIIDGVMMVTSIIGILVPEPATTAAGVAGVASLLNKFRQAWNIGRGIQKTVSGKPLTSSSKPARYGGYKPDGTPAIPLKGEPGYTPTRQQSASPQPSKQKSTTIPWSERGAEVPRSSGARWSTDPDGNSINPFIQKPTSSSATTTTRSSGGVGSSGRTTTSSGGLRGASSVNVGATGLKKSGFDSVTSGQAPFKTNYPSTLDPTGRGVVYSSPSVGQMGPSRIGPGTGGARYAMGSANPFKASEGPGGVVGSLVPSNAPRTGPMSAEPQMAVPQGLATKGIKIFKDIQGGKYPNSPTANKIRQMAQDAGFAPGQSSIPASQLPKTSVLGGIAPNPKMSTTGLKSATSRSSTFLRKEEFLLEQVSDNEIEILLANKRFVKRLPEIIKNMEQEMELIQLYDALFGIEGVNESISVDKKTMLIESHRKILREVKKPVVIPEQPKQKLQKYKPNFAGKYTPQNTPDVTACKQTDEGVKVQNAAGQTWRTKDRHWSRYQSTERMNVIYDGIGHGDQYWDAIVNENQNKKKQRDRKIQEYFNIVAHEKVMLMENPNYVSPFKQNIEEQETLNAPKDPLISRIRNKLVTQIDYPDKPSPMGYPDGPTPEQINGWHPEYGKRANYYNALDPQSAEAMPPTGNPEIDVKVQKARRIKKILGKKA